MEKQTRVRARMRHPGIVVPEAMQALLALGASVQGDLPSELVALLHLRASQINGCSFCVNMHSRELKTEGASDERIFNVAAWRETAYYTDAERAALALTETATRLSDHADPVPEEIWNEAARYFDERGLAALAIQIAAINAWNRLNVIIKQPAGPFSH